LAQRIVAAQRMLETTDEPVAEVAIGCGFGSSAALRMHFGRVLGTSPASYLMQLARREVEPPADLTARAAAALAAFGAQLETWRAQASSSPSVLALFDRIIDDTGYRRFLDDGSDEGVERWENVLELRGLAAEGADDGDEGTPSLDLATFLEQVALVSDQDTLTEDMNAPVLLTLHAAKGLEFPAVFIVGLDEGLLPHYRSLDDSEEMAEERRLLYVGITRAKDRLFLVRAFRRHSFGTGGVCEPSRFLDDLPADRVEGTSAPTRARAVYERQTRWEPAAVAAPQVRYRPGMRVAHAAFGEGFVLESELDRDDEIVTIQFPVGVKRLAASLAPLQILVEADVNDPKTPRSNT
jgi:DNA helicase-2/ATP-dependent DNA helicase PcrA